MPQPAQLSLPRADEAVGDLLALEGDVGAPLTAVLAHGDTFALATGDGRIAFTETGFARARIVEAHRGAVLCAATSPDGVLSGGDDGCVRLSRADGTSTLVWQAQQRHWIDAVAARSNAAIAWACRRTVYLQLGPAPTPFMLDHSHTIGGLAFAPQSNRLAASHYGGVTLWDYSSGTPVKRELSWKGSHLDVCWSRDERFIVTAMQESALHGWRVADAVHFQMSGYPSKPRSMSWSRKGEWLANSGAHEVLLWSFKGKKGPMGTSPDVLARRAVPAVQVAFHPLNDYVAAGYGDGCILLARHSDGRDLVVRRPSGSPVTGLAWSADGKRLAYGTEDGRAGVADFTALDKAKARQP